MSKAVINFKVDEEVKDEAQKLARQLGIPLSAIVNSQLRQLIRSRKFMLDATPTMTPFLEEVLDQVERDRKNSKNITRTRSLEEAFAHIDSL
jgi:addiction module RelB/DinJ family antitoxin